MGQMVLRIGFLLAIAAVGVVKAALGWDCSDACQTADRRFVERRVEGSSYRFEWWSNFGGQVGTLEAPPVPCNFNVDRSWLDGIASKLNEEFGLTESELRAALAGYDPAAGGWRSDAPGRGLCRERGVRIDCEDGQVVRHGVDYVAVLDRNIGRFSAIVQAIERSPIGRETISEKLPSRLRDLNRLSDEFVRHCRYGVPATLADRYPAGFLPPIHLLAAREVVGDCDTKSMLFAGLVAEAILRNTGLDSLRVMFIEFWTGADQEDKFHACVAFGTGLRSLVPKGSWQTEWGRDFLVFDPSCCEEGTRKQRMDRRRSFRDRFRSAIKMMSEKDRVVLVDGTRVWPFRHWEAAVIRGPEGALRVEARGVMRDG